MRRDRRCKLVATLGPASAEDGVVEALFLAGADVFRVNMSHTDHDGLRARIAQLRRVEARVGRPVGVLVDLQGPKLRLGVFASGPHRLEEGATIALDADPAPGDATRVHLPHPEVLGPLDVGHAILVDDGKVRLRVVEKTPGRAVTRVEVAGEVSNRKGVSLPDTTIDSPAMTPKDRADLEAALNVGCDWIALSFVQRPEDVADVKKVARGRALVMAKVEKPQAVARLEEIVEAADGIMVARGDLGVEMPVEEVPAIQKRITRACRRAGKPVVVATQMLESMILSPVPTRAEVSDVATAVYEGADAVMLSAESAAGKFPEVAVATMSRIAETVERDPLYRGILEAQRQAPEATGADAIAVAARDVAATLKVGAVVAWTASGSTALRLARERPMAPVLTLTTSPDVARRLALVWGVHALVGADPADVDDMARRATQAAREEGFARAGERVIVVAGLPFGTPGATNMLRIAYVGRD